MELRDFAERVLFADSLTDKLTRPRAFADERPGPPIDAPRYPQRPPGLELDRWQREAKVPFPSQRQLGEAPGRAIAIHFFANHELLALELMALCLLKFPGAEPAFRRTIRQTMLEEQVHAQLYIDRMQQLGIEFGAYPVNDFFWKCTAEMSSPIEFVAHMSLTFEQANLDFAEHYAGLFEDVGDGDTGAILSRIHRDEIRHVKRGLNWFNRWRPPHESEWQAYRRTVRFPLTPKRAKGIGFNAEARRRAGLSEDFITQLQVFSHSRGRTPDVYVFNPSCEDQIAAPGKPASTVVRQLQQDLETLPLFVAGEDDVVIVQRTPNVAFLRRLQNAGFELPQFVTCDGTAANLAGSALQRRTLNGFQPWGWSPVVSEFLQPLAANVGRQQAHLTWQPAWRPLFCKSFSASLLRELLPALHAQHPQLCAEAIVGRVCGSWEAVHAAAELAAAAGYPEVVAKGDLGASGRHAVRLSLPATQRQQQAVAALLRGHAAVVVEPWLDKVCDLSLQLDITEDRVQIVGMTRFTTDRRGQYRATLTGRLADGLDTETRQCLYGGDPRQTQRLFAGIAAALAPRMQALGFRGPVGIDALVYRDHQGRLALKPIVEINPRYTMGRLALAMRRRIATGRTAIWLLAGVRQLQKCGYPTAALYAEDLARRWPLQTVNTGGVQVSDGALCTNDPAAAVGCLGVLLVAESLQACRLRLPELASWLP